MEKIDPKISFQTDRHKSRIKLLLVTSILFLNMVSGTMGYVLGKRSNAPQTANDQQRYIQPTTIPFGIQDKRQKNCGFFNNNDSPDSSENRQVLSCFENAYSHCQSAQLGYMSGHLQNGVEDDLTVEKKDDGTCSIKLTTYASNFDTITIVGYCGNLLKKQHGITISSCQSVSLRKPLPDITFYSARP